MGQVEKNRQIDVSEKIEICMFNCKNLSFCNETFLNGKEDTSRLPKNSLELECTRVGCCKNAT